MRILFLLHQPMWIYGLPDGFRDLGHEVMISGPLQDQDITAMLSNFRPELVFTMGWSPDHVGNGLEIMKKCIKASGAPFIFWATEDPSYTECFSLPFARETRPDFIFTINKEKMIIYNSLGYRSGYLDFGFHENVHKRVESMESYRCPVAVVANAYPHLFTFRPDSLRLVNMQTLIAPVLKDGIPIHFWGSDWHMMKSFLGFEIPDKWIHGPLAYTDANKVYSSADIVIGLQNRPEQVTQRTFEILGSEGFLLTADTPSIRDRFTPGKDLVVSSSPDETVETVRYFLGHPDIRESVKKQGRAAVEKYNYRNRAKYIIDMLVLHGIIRR